MDELLNTENLRAVLEEYGVAVRNLYQDRLILHDRIATGDLLNSVETRVEYNGTAYEVKMDLADYWRYVEMDTEPHWPPPSAEERQTPHAGAARLPHRPQDSRLRHEGPAGSHRLRGRHEQGLPGTHCGRAGERRRRIYTETRPHSLTRAHGPLNTPRAFPLLKGVTIYRYARINLERL